MKLRQKLKLSPLALVLLLVAVDALARVGGGQSFSGGGGGGFSSGGGYSGGYSGGGGISLYFLAQAIIDLVRLFAWLTVTYPVIGIPMDIAAVWVIWRMINAYEQSEYYSGAAPEPGYDRDMVRNIQAGNAKRALDRLREEQDPNFSQILFEDFTYSLFAEVHKFRGNHRLTDLADYLSQDVIGYLKNYHPGVREVQGIVIGGSRIESVSGLDEPQVQIVVSFEANYTETLSNGGSQSWYAQEQWVFVRNRGVQSRPPEKIRLITCPACGAPPAKNPDGTCPNCGRLIRSGTFDWFVESVTIDATERPPLLTTTVEEVGTDLPTLYDHDFNAAARQLQSEYADFSWDDFEKRVRWIFMQLQTAWTERKWENSRPYETDNLFQSHYYWIAEYQKQHLINVLKDITVTRVAPVKILEDRFYVSITARVFASMVDYTQTEDGRRVCGNPHRPRVFTEYWTLIRSRKPKPSNQPDANCPSCGAPLKINMAGNCEYCQAKVTSGEFDWVLSRIEQDEEYA